MINKSRLIVALAFVLTFVLTLGAGTMLGVGVSRMCHPPHDRSWLADELNLSPQQREQMKEIWSSMGQPGPGSRPSTTSPATSPTTAPVDRRQQLRKDRDDAIANLIPADKKAAYDKIIADYNTTMDELNRQRSKAFQDAVERTKKILNDQQRQKYEEILKRRDDHRRGPRGSGGMSPGNEPR